MIPARATVFSFFRLSVYSRKNMLFGVLRTRYCTRKCILVWRTTLINHRGAIVDGLLAVLWVLCVFMSPSQQGSSLSIDRFIYIYIYTYGTHKSRPFCYGKKTSVLGTAADKCEVYTFAVISKIRDLL